MNTRTNLIVAGLTLSFVVNTGLGINFKQIAYIPEGQYGSYGFIRAFDTNHNTLAEIVFLSYKGVGNSCVIDYEYRPLNNYIIVDTLVPYGKGWCWNIGYIDSDSLCDIVVERGDSIFVYESPSYNSYPDSLVWKGEISGVGLSRCYIVDLDRDDKREILTCDGSNNIVYIFETTTDNQYTLVYVDNFINDIGPGVATFASDDFDGDSLEEFVTSNCEGWVAVWECVGDNQYEVVWTDIIWLAPGINALNAYDDVSANDMDQDGKPEFIIQSVYNSNFTWTALFSFFEAIGDNIYAEVYRDSVTGIATFPDYYSASYCGDIDADGVDEAVMALSNNFVIYKATGNNTFQKIFTAYPSGNGRANTSICIYDMNQNGYKEIIESGAWSSESSATMIWEIEAVKVLYPNGSEIFQSATQETIRWRKFTPPGADSFELLISFNNGLDYQTITTIGQSDESTFVWTIPDTSSDSCLIAIKAFGPGIGWDESDAVFKIGGPGIEEMQDTRYRIQDIRLYQNTPNPFRDYTVIKYALSSKHYAEKNLSTRYSLLATLRIYNSAGQLVKSFNLESCIMNHVSIISWEGNDNSGRKLPAGIYFVRLEADAYKKVEKAILLR